MKVIVQVNSSVTLDENLRNVSRSVNADLQAAGWTTQEVLSFKARTQAGIIVDVDQLVVHHIRTNDPKELEFLRAVGITVTKLGKRYILHPHDDLASLN